MFDGVKTETTALDRIIAFLEQLPDEQFNITIFSNMAICETTHLCHSVGCIAGWLVINERPEAIKDFKLIGGSWWHKEAADILGIGDVLALKLFVPMLGDNLPRTPNREDAIRVLKKFRDTGEVDWHG